MSGGQAQKKQSFLQGVAVLTAATIIVKLLGFIYKVPLQQHPAGTRASATSTPPTTSTTSC